MVLKDDFYTVIKVEKQNEEEIVTLRLNADHLIYRAHFPNNPITPGVCIVQICKELAQMIMGGLPAKISSVKSIKFMNVINPLVNSEITFGITLTPTSTGYAEKVTVSAGDTFFAKISMKLVMDKVCVIIPTYNNMNTVIEVINNVLEYCRYVIAVNDGSTDGTARLLDGVKDKVTVMGYADNRGKGYALRAGFEEALRRGFKYAITIDSDGQHFASDIPLFYDAIVKYPDALVVGSRMFDQENMPSANTFANRFSNFWFTVQTGCKLPDTQTGYRLYPICRMAKMKFITSRYESELEMLVRCKWRGIKVVPISVGVYYAPEGERVTHFRKGRDFFRISLLNTVLTLCAILYGYPSMLIHRITGK